jgi:hypothetical protein
MALQVELPTPVLRLLTIAAAALICAFAMFSLQISRGETGSLSFPGPARAEAAQVPAQPLPAAAQPVAAKPAAPEPTGRETPLVPLPASGTPTLTVRSGQSVELYSHPGGEPVATLAETTEFGSPTVLTVIERKGNWAGVPTEQLSNGDLGWVKLGGDDLSIDSVGQSIVIDLSSMSAKLLRGDEVERSWQVGIGAPDTPTPIGHFSITDEIQGGLNAAYGCCALALSATQPNLPPGWTGGDRMAIHGTSAPLGEANSTGCVHSGEADLLALLDKAPIGTPVTIKN